MSENSRVRISIIGVVIVALFSSLVVRLWFLQMGPENKLRAEAISLATRKIVTESPRGTIRDRNGVVLAQDVAAWAVTVDRNLKKSTHQRVMGQLSELLGIPQSQLEQRFKSPRQTVLKPAIVATKITQDQRLAILQHIDDYPGVSIEQLTVRDYPEAAKLNDPGLAAQVLGYVGEIDPAQLKSLKKQGYQPGDLIGKDGLEAAYESVLHGKPQVETVQVDPRGTQVGPPLSVDPGSVGDDVTLTIDANIQHAAEVALQNGIDHARTLSDPTGMLKAPAGAVVVLDVHDGSVVAMASNPSFPPSGWVNGLTQNDLNLLNSPLSNYPLLNRATQGQYAPGSAFKLVTSLADTRFGVRSPFFPYNDSGSVVIGGDARSFHNDNGVANGTVDLSRALTVSSDTYFYSAGNEFWGRWFTGDQTTGLGIQTQARDFGLGSKTGIEISEQPGRVPDPTWKQGFANILYKDPQQRHDNGTWYPGDQVNEAVGQGDVLVTPLQLADAYATFANGGTDWVPHLGMTIKDAHGKVVKTIKPKARATMQFDPVTYQQMMMGFTGAVNDPSGTAHQAFQGYLGPTVAGKTGTAQVTGKQPTSVFASFFPAQAPQYVVVALVEEGGHGAQTAAPIARQVIESITNPLAPVTPITTTGGSD
jgi:penicillin-binding protein 2